MSLAACIAKAAKDREITPEERADLDQRFDAYVQDALAMGHPAGDADRLAGRWLMDDMEADAFTSARRALGTERAKRVMQGEVAKFKNRAGEADIGEYRQFKIDGTGRIDVGGSFDTATGRRAAVIQQAFADLNQLVETFLGPIQGTMFNRPLFLHVIRELAGEDTGNAAAKAMAKAWMEVTERLRKRFNAAGGVIQKLDGWIMSQAHDLRKVHLAGKDAWKAFIRPLLDPARMKHPNGKRGLTPSEVEAALDYIFDSIVSAGDAHLVPAMSHGGKSFAARHADPRWLVFKDADSWIAYQQRFGEENLLEAMLSHVRRMASDIAAMEIFGPNPDAMQEFLRQWARLEAGKAQTAAGSTLVPKKRLVSRGQADPQAYIRSKNHRADSMWSAYKGGAAPANWAFADAVDVSRDIFTSSHLGGTGVLAAMTDPMFALNMRMFYRLPTVQVWGGYLKSLNPANPAHRRAAQEMAIALDAAVHSHGAAARYTGDAGVRRWSGQMADGVLTLTGLKQITQTGRNATGVMLSQQLAKWRGLSWSQLRRPHRDLLVSMRLSEQDWDVIRAAPVKRLYGVDHVSPYEIARNVDRAVGERLLAGIHETADQMTPAATIRASSLLKQPQIPRGTIPAEMVRVFGYLKTFAVSLHMTHVYKVYEILHRQGALTAARYWAGMSILAGLGGVMTAQLIDLASGRKPREIGNKDLYMDGMLRGGGFGPIADYLRAADQDRGGLTAYIAGPVVTMAEDIGQATIGNVGEIWRGDDPRIGRDVVDVLRTYTPGANAFYTRLAMDRLIFDQLQRMVDPDAQEAFDRQMSYREREYEQDYWWREGEVSPN